MRNSASILSAVLAVAGPSIASPAAFASRDDCPCAAAICGSTSAHPPTTVTVTVSVSVPTTTTVTHYTSATTISQATPEAATSSQASEQAAEVTAAPSGATPSCETITMTEYSTRTLTSGVYTWTTTEPAYTWTRTTTSSVEGSSLYSSTHYFSVTPVIGISTVASTTEMATSSIPSLIPSYGWNHTVPSESSHSRSHSNSHSESQSKSHSKSHHKSHHKSHSESRSASSIVSNTATTSLTMYPAWATGSVPSTSSASNSSLDAKPFPASSTVSHNTTMALTSSAVWSSSSASTTASTSSTASSIYSTPSGAWNGTSGVYNTTSNAWNCTSGFYNSTTGGWTCLSDAWNTASDSYNTASSTSTTQQTSSSATISSHTACATTPEKGTYCGFINPEDPCAPQPDGYGPVPTPDTVSAFEAYPAFHAMAAAAPVLIPSNNTRYQYERNFTDLSASVSTSNYITLYTLHSYSAAECAAKCDETVFCRAFNIYVERDPSKNPSTNASTAPTVWGRDCPNPASITNYKCALWGSEVDESVATNHGDYREEFQVVIAGSDGYNLI